MFGKRAATVACFLLLVLGGLLFTLKTDELERGRYTAFYHSFVEDGDLNIVNHVDAQDQWLVTKNLNHPTHLSSGILPFWFPFYYYADLFFPRPLIDRLHVLGLNSYQVLAIIRNATFSMLALLLLSRISKFILAKSDPERKQTGFEAGALIFLILSATPFFWYMFFQPFNTELTLFFLSSLWVYDFYLNPVSGQSMFRLFLNGLFIGLGTAAKVTFILVFLPVFLELVFSSESRMNPRKTLRQIAAAFVGVALPLGLMTLNNFIQCGELVISHHLASLDLIQSHENLAYLMFFGAPNGILVCSPIFLVSLVLAILRFGSIFYSFLFRGKPIFFDRAVRPMFVVVCAIIAMLARFSSLLTYPDEIASRILLPLAPFCVVFLIHEWSIAKQARRVSFLVVLAFAIFINWGHISQYSLEGNIFKPWAALEYYSKFWRLLSIRIRSDMGNVPTLGGLAYFVPFLLLLSGCVGSVADRVRLGPPFKIATLTLFLFYSLVTVSNARVNPEKVQKLRKAGFLSRSVVSKGMVLNYYDEATSIYELGEKYLPVPYSSKARLARLSYIELATHEVDVDPIHFVDRFKQGMIKKSIDN